MQKLIILLSLFFAFNFSYAQYDSIAYGGYKRSYLVHLPTGYTQNAKLPLVIAMHGGFGNADNLQNQSQLSVKADAENFIVVYPEGLKEGILNISSWNAGWCCGWASKNNIDDVGFIDALLDTLIDQYSIDSGKVYATGMSNGGFMAYRLACELSNRIAAIATVAASMSMTNCTPERPIPIISFHSYLDEHVPYSGGIGNGPSLHHNSPQDSVLQVWAEANLCLNLNDTIIHNDQFLHRNWSNCDCESIIEQYATYDGGHSWPGGKQTLVGDSVSSFINATDIMWSFFKQHSLDCNSITGLNWHTKNNKLKIYPNPFTDDITIKFSMSQVNTEIKLIIVLEHK